LPDVFTLASERNWPATLIAALVNSLLAIIIGAGVYGNWVETFPLVQHGAPLFWVILNTGVNFVLSLGVVSACLTWLIFSPRQQISATREGLFCRLGWRTSFMPWQQASLFAVIGQVARRGQQPVLIYELASKDTIIRWPSSNRSVSAYWRKNLLTHLALSRGLVRRPPAEACAFAQQVEMLNIIVAERSGLALYDLRQESGEGY
jgi:hypothetical protein